MPKNVRNFWITTAIDGRKTVDASGPVAKDGGFATTIKVRDDGVVTSALVITGVANEDGTLKLTVIDASDYTILFKKDTHR